LGYGATTPKEGEQSFSGFSEKDLNTVIDLRVFMDPAPHTISELAPMASVYHMFNQMGVRHLPVFDERQRLCGIITRKDMVPELIEAKLYENTEKAQRAARKLQLMRSAAAALKKKSWSARTIHGGNLHPQLANLDSRRRPSLGCFSNAGSAEGAEEGRRAGRQRKGSGAGRKEKGASLKMKDGRSRPGLKSRYASTNQFGHGGDVPLANLVAPLERSNSAPIIRRGEILLSEGRAPRKDGLKTSDSSTSQDPPRSVTPPPGTRYGITNRESPPTGGILRPPGGGAFPKKERKNSGCSFVVSEDAVAIGQSDGDGPPPAGMALYAREAQGDSGGSPLPLRR